MRLFNKKTILIALPLLLIMMAGVARTIEAESVETKLGNQTNSAQIICQPSSGASQDSCMPILAAVAQSESKPHGQETAAAPFNPQKIDPELSNVPYSYAKLNLSESESAPLYGSAADAIAGVNAINAIPAGGIRYVSYTNRVDSGSGHYVQARNGAWLRASPAAIPAATLGRTFTETPSNYFGWVFEGCNPYLAPNYNSGVDKNIWFDREQVLEVFEIIRDDKSVWFKVGENQWLDRIHFRVATFNTTPPEGVPTDRWIELDLYEQVLMVYEKNALVYAVLVATGMKPFYTQPGIFQVYEKKEADNMTGSFEADKSDFYSLEDVPFVLYHDQARAFHGAYWRAWYGYEQSHGCINMSIGDAHWLYNWSNIGEYIYIHDPSGVTPTDPSYYGAGGA